MLSNGCLPSQQQKEGMICFLYCLQQDMTSPIGGCAPLALPSCITLRIRDLNSTPMRQHIACKVAVKCDDVLAD